MRRGAVRQGVEQKPELRLRFALLQAEGGENTPLHVFGLSHFLVLRVRDGAAD